jgi:hypothetical protein
MVSVRQDSGARLIHSYGAAAYFVILPAALAYLASLAPLGVP